MHKSQALRTGPPIRVLWLTRAAFEADRQNRIERSGVKSGTNAGDAQELVKSEITLNEAR